MNYFTAGSDNVVSRFEADYQRKNNREDMENITHLGRIDRAIAENLSDIRVSFEDYAGLALDFIIFISKRIKYDLFGYTCFTLQEFCEATGRNRGDLAQKLPAEYLDKKKPHTVEGYRFETVFEHLLIQLMKTNLLFSNVYTTKDRNETVKIESIRIIRDVQLNYNRRSNEIKRYEVRLSPELLDGFIKRYYTIDTEAYKLAGKGRGRENRQAVVIYLSVLRHLLFSQNNNVTTIKMDVISSYLNTENKKTFHQKEMVDNVLKLIRDKAKFPFNYKFVSGSKNYTYYIELSFLPAYSKATFLKEHNFYYGLLDDLKLLYNSKYKDLVHRDKEPFQAWLTTRKVDVKEKVQVLKKVYAKAFAINLTDNQAMNIYFKGLKEP
ncbi:hypothetical protein [Olivibacter sitiensis]|uniref:hypothetical protein n=1 Tax=Olivibacter sitiensis TaxID=376470 RepID=UPI00041963AB|nr:hypothetical protein [Olivibacter sitiensis]